MKKVITFLVSATLALLMFTGCPMAPEEETTSSEKISSEEIESMKSQLSALDNPTSLSVGTADGKYTEEVVASTPETPVQKEATSTSLPSVSVTTKETVKMTGTYDESYLLNPSTDIIYPGSVIRGGSIDDGTYVPVTLGEKNEVAISYTGLTGVTDKDGNDGVVSGSIVPSNSTYQELHKKIMNQTIGGASSTETFSARQVSCQDEMSCAVKANASYNGASVSAGVTADFSKKDGKETYTYLVQFAQTFYTVNLDINDVGFLYKELNMQDIGTTRPVYVSSIAYGRLAYLTVTSDTEWSNIATDLSAYAKNASVTVEGGTAVTVDSRVSSSTIGITTVGFTQSITTVEEFFDAVRNDGFSSTNAGQVVAYKLRFVDTNEVANTIFNGTYTLSKTVQQNGTITIKFTDAKLDSHGWDDGVGNENEFYGSILIDNTAFWAVPMSSTQDYTENLDDITIQGVTPVTITGNSCQQEVNIKVYLAEDDGAANDDIGDEIYIDGNTPTTKTIGDLIGRKTITCNDRIRLNYSVTYNYPKI